MMPGSERRVKVTEKQAKSILNKSKIHDYCINPYTGCSHDCVYCYAKLFMARYSGHTEAWGTFVDVKVNAVELLKRELPKARKGTIWIASVCDPYQPLEKSYRLTRRLLEQIVPWQFPVEIQTKSCLVVRDLDLLLRLENVSVGLTVPTDDPSVSRLFEPGASPLEERLRALEVLRQAGVRTFAFAGPLLPGNPERLAGLLADKVGRVLIDRMNYLPAVKGFYRRHKLEKYLSDDFFREQAGRLSRALTAAGVESETLF
jgi:DNA repair photolyase